MSQFSVSVDESDRQKLRDIARKHGISVSAVVRILLNQRLSFPNWEMYDRGMLARIETLSSMSIYQLAKVDLLLESLSAEGHTETVSKSTSRSEKSKTTMKGR